MKKNQKSEVKRRKKLISRYFFVYYNTKFINEIKARKTALVLVTCNILFAVGTIFVPDTVFLNLLFPLGMFALPRFFEVQKRMNLQKDIGSKMLDLQTDPKDENINHIILSFVKQSKEDAFLMILLMYAGIIELMVAKSIILKVVALMIVIVMVKVNYDKKCFKRNYKIFKMMRNIDIIAIPMIAYISFIISKRLNLSFTNDIVIVVLCIISLTMGYLSRNKNTDHIFSTVAKKGFDTPNHNYKYEAQPSKIMSPKEYEEEQREKAVHTIDFTLDADARARQSKKEKQVYKNYQLFLYNGRKNRELEKEAHKQWVHEQYMSDEERKEYEAKKKRELEHKDSGYVEIEKDNQTVDRFSKRGQR